jgi:small multidrug resistance pump
MAAAYVYLAVAVLFEVIGTSALKLSEGFTRLWPSLLCVLGYGVAFYALGQCLRSMSVGVAYAMWCAGGIVLISLIGWLWFKQPLDMPAIAGVSLIFAGVTIISLYSKTAVH